MYKSTENCEKKFRAENFLKANQIEANIFQFNFLKYRFSVQKVQ